MLLQSIEDCKLFLQQPRRHMATRVSNFCISGLHIIIFVLHCFMFEYFNIFSFHASCFQSYKFFWIAQHRGCRMIEDKREDAMTTLWAPHPWPPMIICNPLMIHCPLSLHHVCNLSHTLPTLLEMRALWKMRGMYIMGTSLDWTRLFH